MNFSWAMDLDPKGANNQIKEAIDKRYLPEDEGTTSDQVLFDPFKEFKIRKTDLMLMSLIVFNITKQPPTHLSLTCLMPPQQQRWRTVRTAAL